MIKACLFDLDGTVADTNNLIFESFRHTFKEHNINDVSDEAIYSFFGEPLFRTMERFVSVEDAPNLVSTYRDYNETRHDDMIDSFPHVQEVLDILKKRGIRLAIVTSKRREMAERSLDVLKLRDYFDLIVTPENTLKHKPDGEPVEYALKEYGISPKEAIMVGDSPFDLLSGKAAGTYTCGVRYTRLDPQHLEATSPDYMIDSMDKLIDVVDDLDSRTE